jgi:sigma-B regulation protein RsbU (phosphoserine phosphatase)
MHGSELGAALGGLRGPTHTEALPEGILRERLHGHGLECVVPLGPTGACGGAIAMGARASGAPFGDEDCDFVLTLGRQALAALENVRLQRVQLEKQRQDREMQIAREIQVSLFPESFPDIPGFDVAAEARPCYEVGGDYYDVMGLGDGRWALLIADVSGKGVPASILMASVHASLHALAGTGEPAAIVARLNRFLYESTQPSRYVTLFYGELDPAGGRLTYVNGGHVPPYLLRARGGLRRLDVGGPAVGLLEDATYEAETIGLGTGDVVAAVTDGATEACSPADEEFGDARVVEALAQARSRGAAGRLRGLFERVGEWAGPAGQSDDLTALVLEAR